MEQQKQFKKNLLPAEPSGKKLLILLFLANDANSTLIVFRMSNVEERVERRFYKNNKIEDLYNYIDSLSDKNIKSYELIQTFPFTIFNDKTKTLEELKLYPNAVIQVREL